jgi:hypothetical protein
MMNNRSSFSFRNIKTLVIGLILTGLSGAEAVEAQTFSLYSDFQAMTLCHRWPLPPPPIR